MLDFKVNFPEGEHKHEHETVEVEVFSILDDDEKEGFMFSKKITINGEDYLEYVDDYDLAKRAFDLWKKEGKT